VIEAATAGGDPVTIKLTRPGSVDGTLVGFSRTPDITATQIGVVDRVLQGDGIVTGNTFSITGLRPGHYTVEAKAGVEVDGQAVDVRSGETVHLTLTSRGVGHIEGTVYEYGTTTPIIGMRCDAPLSMGGQMGGPPDARMRQFTDAVGHFSLTTPLGRVRVLCFDGDRGPGGVDVDVTATSAPQVTVYSVRPTFGTTPSEPGFRLQPATLPITVLRVDPGSAAAAAGIQAGDHLVSVDGGSLDGLMPLSAWFLVINHAPGSTVVLGVEHAGTGRSVTLPLGAQ
jgi:hypothetical protein